MPRARPSRLFPYTTLFRSGAGQEPGHVDEGEDRDDEGIAEADESGRLLGGVDVEGACQLHRLVGDDSDAGSLDPAEAGDDVRGEQLGDLEELAVIEHGGDHVERSEEHTSE